MRRTKRRKIKTKPEKTEANLNKSKIFERVKGNERKWTRNGKKRNTKGNERKRKRIYSKVFRRMSRGVQDIAQHSMGAGAETAPRPSHSHEYFSPGKKEKKEKGHQKSYPKKLFPEKSFFRYPFLTHSRMMIRM